MNFMWATTIFFFMHFLGRIEELASPLREHVKREQWVRNVSRLKLIDREARWRSSRVASLDDERSGVVARAEEARRRTISTRGAPQRKVGHAAKWQCLQLELEEVEGELGRARNASERLLEEREALRREQKGLKGQTDAVPHTVLSNLSDAQSEEQFEAFYTYYYGHRHLSSDQSAVLRMRLLLAPLTTGHWPHWNTPYQLSGRFVAYGDDLRKPVSAEGEEAEEIHPEARNRMRTVNGELKGRGSAGYKGIFSPPEGRRSYNPKRQLLMTNKGLEEMLRPPL